MICISSDRLRDWTIRALFGLFCYKKQIVCFRNEGFANLDLFLWLRNLYSLDRFFLESIDDNNVVTNTCACQEWPVKGKWAHVLENSLLHLIFLLEFHMLASCNILKLAPVQFMCITMRIHFCFECGFSLKHQEFIVSHHKECDELFLRPITLLFLFKWMEIHYFDDTWLDWTVELHYLVRGMWVLELEVLSISPAAHEIEPAFWVILNQLYVLVFQHVQGSLIHKIIFSLTLQKNVFFHIAEHQGVSVFWNLDHRFLWKFMAVVQNHGFIPIFLLSILFFFISVNVEQDNLI